MLTFAADAETDFQDHCVGACKVKLLKVVESTFLGSEHNLPALNSVEVNLAAPVILKHPLHLTH